MYFETNHVLKIFKSLSLNYNYSCKFQASRQSEADDESPLAMQHRALEEKKQAESLINPTPVMLEVLQRMEEREKERENMTWQQQLQHLTVSKKHFGFLIFFPSMKVRYSVAALFVQARKLCMCI